MAELSDDQRIRILLELQTEQLAKEAKRAERAVEGIERRFDSSARATQKYERDLRNLDKSLAAGAITQGRYEAALENVEREFRTATQAAEVFDVATDRIGSTSGRFAGQMQNASYQVGDFAVQIASGGSAVTALSQQLPQLLGGFGLLGAGLGALVAIGGAAYKLLGDTSEGADEAGTSVEAFAGALANLGTYSEIAGSDLDTLRRKFGDFAEEVRDNAKYLAEVSVAKAVEVFKTGDNSALLDGLKEASRLYDEMSKQAEELQQARDQQSQGFASSEQVKVAQDLFDNLTDDAMAAAKALGLTMDQVDGVRDALVSATEAEGLDGLRDGAQNALDVIRQIYPEASNIPAALVPAVEGMEKIASLASQGLTTIEDAGEAASGFSASLLDAVNNAITAGETAQNMLSSLQDQAEMQRLIAEYGADSEEVARARADAEREAQEAIVDALAVSDEMKAALMEAWDAANGIAGADMAGGISAASAEARALADWLGISLANAAKLAAMGPQGTPDNYSGPGAGYVSSGRGGDPRTMGGSAADIQNAEADKFLRDWKPAKAPKASGGGGRKGGGSRGGKSEAAREAEREAEEVKRTVERIYDSTRTSAEAYAIELERLNALHSSGALDLDTFNRAVGKLNEDLQAEQFEKLRAAIDDISGSIADAIVNGESLGESFGNIVKGMARDMIESGINDMISQLFQPAGGGAGILGGLLGGMFGGGFGGAPSGSSVANAAAGSGGLYAKGAAFRGGAVVPFASGGVVSGPTLFPMSGGRTGLMGEAGAEAIMPLVRGSGGKLGVQSSGGGAQAVHVTVGVSADGNGNLMPFVQSVTQQGVAANNAQRDKAFVGKVNSTRANTHRRVR